MFTFAAEYFICVIAFINELLNFKLLIGKFNTALCVLAPYIASKGTSRFPIESFSILVFLLVIE